MRLWTLFPLLVTVICGYRVFAETERPGDRKLQTEFQCTDGLYIPSTWRCDGEHDCEDESDEKDCENDTQCHGFLCKDNHCIPEKWKCDGNIDCPDGSDEGDQCPKSDVCAEHSCSQSCKLTPSGPECYCNNGYLLENGGKNCSDIDECSTEGTCSQICTNLPGSYKCSCTDGYSVQNNTCMAMREEPLLIFSSKNGIKGYFLRSKRLFVMHEAVKQASVVDVDPLENRVYWIEPSNSSAVYSSKLYEKDRQITINHGLMLPEDIAVDYVARNLYFTDSRLMQILVCKFDGTLCHALHNLNDGSKPRALALYLIEGLLYWSDWSDDAPGIYKSGMDGSQLSAFVSKDIKWPNGITIDHTTNRLYWIDAKLQTIEYISLDGSKRKILLQREINHPYSLSVFEDNLYWSDWGTFSLKTCNKFTAHNITTITNEFGKYILGVHVYHPVQTIQRNNPCSSNRCSHMCLIAPLNGFKCACPTGFTLSINGETCKLDDSFPMLIVNDESRVYQIKPEMVGSSAITELPIAHIDKVGRIAYDWRKKTFYVADMKTPAIYELNASFSARSDLVKSNIVEPTDLEFDWRSDNLYWTDSSKGTVEVISTKTNLRTTLVENLTKPNAIALVPQIGRMFVSTLGYGSAIAMYNMDGSNQVDLVHAQTSVLAVHPTSSLLFWADPQTSTISYLDYNSGKREVLSRRVRNVTSIAVSDKYVYWTDTKNHALNYMKHGTQMKFVMTLPNARSTFSQRKVLFAAKPSISRSVDLSCLTNNGGCSHLCLTTEGGRSCVCPAGMMLAEDGITCTSICPGNDFRCSNGRCILINWKCDHRDDCGDNSDEIGCPPSSPSCNKDQSLCSSGECIPSLWKCDGENDCPDGGDEKDCDISICDEESQFRCSNGQCLPKSWICDGTDDCIDGSDEKINDGKKCGSIPRSSSSSTESTKGYHETLSTDETNGYFTTLSTKDANVYSETAKTENDELLSTSTPMTNTRVKYIWGKHLLPVYMLGNKEDNI